MQPFKNQLLSIDRGEYTKEELVSILILVTSKLEINTISEMARTENKTHRGIQISKQYRKIKIGKQLFAIKGVTEDQFPF